MDILLSSPIKKALIHSKSKYFPFNLDAEKKKTWINQFTLYYTLPKETRLFVRPALKR